MKWVSSLFRRVYDRVYGWFVPPYKTEFVEDLLPRQIEPRTLYIVQEDGFLEKAALLCPCGCGSTLQLNLLTDERPCWHVTCHGNGTASLYPSIWRKKGCGAHFWFRRGRVERL